MDRTSKIVNRKTACIKMAMIMTIVKIMSQMKIMKKTIKKIQ